MRVTPTRPEPAAKRAWPMSFFTGHWPGRLRAASGDQGSRLHGKYLAFRPCNMPISRASSIGLSTIHKRPASALAPNLCPLRALLEDRPHTQQRSVEATVLRGPEECMATKAPLPNARSAIEAPTMRESATSTVWRNPSRQMTNDSCSSRASPTARPSRNPAVYQSFCIISRTVPQSTTGPAPQSRLSVAKSSASRRTSIPPRIVRSRSTFGSFYLDCTSITIRSVKASQSSPTSPKAATPSPFIKSVSIILRPTPFRPALQLRLSLLQSPHNRRLPAILQPGFHGSASPRCHSWPSQGGISKEVPEPASFLPASQSGNLIRPAATLGSR